MKKSFFCFASILIISFILCSCNQSSSQSNSPESTVDSFLKSVQSQEYASSKTYYSENLDNMANFKNQIEDISPHVANELFKKTADFTYTINNVAINPEDPNKATVNVTIDAYDLGPSFESTVLDYIKSDIEMTFDGAKNEEIIKQAEDTIVKKITDTTQKFSTTVDIALTKKDDTWKLDKISDNPDLLNALSGNIIYTINKLSKTLDSIS